MPTSLSLTVNEIQTLLVLIHYERIKVEKEWPCTATRLRELDSIEHKLTHLLSD